MSISSITRKTCKCGCSKYPDIGFAGYSKWCRPDLMEAKIKNQEQRQRKAASATRQVRKLKNEVGQETIESGEKQALINELDFLCSRIVRLTACDENKLLKCYCCDKVIPFNLAQCSHFISRSNMATRFDIKRNLRPSCRFCNENLSGNLEVFAQRLEQEQIGLPSLLYELSKEVHKWTRQELKEMCLDLRPRLQILEKRFKA